MPGLAVAVAIAVAAGAQAAPPSALDRSDPSLATRQLPAPLPAPAAAKAGSASIAAPDPAETPSLPGVTASAIDVRGAPDIPFRDLAPLLSSFVGHRLSPDDLRDLLALVSGVARAKGYVFARSSIPPQALADGTLLVQLDEGHVDEVRLEGRNDGSALAILDRLIGRPVRKDELDSTLLLLQDLPGISLGQVRYAREAGRGVLIVPLNHDAVSAHFGIDNWGDKALGPVRAQASVQINGVLGTRDAFSAQLLSTPAEPSELKVASLRYAVQPTESGTELALYGSVAGTHSGSFLRDLDDQGRSHSIGISISQPLIRRRKVSLWLSGEIDTAAADERFGDLKVRHDRATNANVSLNGYAPLAGGRIRAGVGVTQGLGLFNATDGGAPLASRPDAGHDFTMFNLWWNWTGDLAGPFSARLAMTAQLATNPLLAFEQISIGGPAFGRAYDFNERSGDEGVLGSAEIRAKLLDRSHGLLRWAQLYGYADAGTVSNLRNDFGTGNLYSAGAGARFQLGKSTRVEAEAAFPINKWRFDSGNKSPRLSASIGFSL